LWSAELIEPKTFIGYRFQSRILSKWRDGFIRSGKGNSLRACRSKQFPNQKSTTYRAENLGTDGTYSRPSSRCRKRPVCPHISVTHKRAALSAVNPSARAACSVWETPSPCGWYRQARHAASRENTCHETPSARSPVQPLI